MIKVVLLVFLLSIFSFNQNIVFAQQTIETEEIEQTEQTEQIETSEDDQEAEQPAEIEQELDNKAVLSNETIAGNEPVVEQPAVLGAQTDSGQTVLAETGYSSILAILSGVTLVSVVFYIYIISSKNSVHKIQK